MLQIKILACVFMLLAAAAAQSIPKPTDPITGQKTSQPSDPVIHSAHETQAAPVTYPVADVKKARPASTAINAFGLKMLTGMAAQHQHQNVFISPLSIFAALVMTENGAAGQTRDAMRKALAIPDSL